MQLMQVCAHAAGVLVGVAQYSPLLTENRGATVCLQQELLLIIKNTHTDQVFQVELID